MKTMIARTATLTGLMLAGALVPVAPAAAAPGLTITARSATLGDTPDTILLVGKYTCGPFPGGVPERGVIDLGIRQVVDNVEVTGIGYLEPTVCTGRPQSYTAELTTYAGSFVSGAGRWSASGYVEGDGGMQHTFVPPTRIRIRPAN